MPSFGNFVPVHVGTLEGGAAWFVHHMLSHGIVVRAMGKDLVRITVGRESDNNAVLEAVAALQPINGNSVQGLGALLPPRVASCRCLCKPL